MPTKYNILLYTLIILCLTVMAVAASTAPAVLCPDEMRLEAQKMEILNGESGYRHYDKQGKIIKGDAGRAIGIAQFHRATFNRLKKLAGRPELNIKKKEDQLWLFDWAMRNGHAHNWTVARWLAAEKKPAFKIDQRHVFKKGSARCPTRKPVTEAPPPEIPPQQLSTEAAPDFVPVSDRHAHENLAVFNSADIAAPITTINI